MSANAEQRKLAAIMFTDMVDYSALSQRDSKVALELLEEHRQILRKIFPDFNGTEIKTIGDAFLVEFQSALEAAECAIAIQRALAKRNTDAPAERQIQLRIGVHIGDVVHRDGDVYGDGVNIASRIEPLANPGGICLSMDVERQIRNALDTRFEKLAPTELKNISVPMDLFRIVLPWETKALPSKPEIPATAGKLPSKLETGTRSRRILATSIAIILAATALLGYQLWRTRNAVAPRSASEELRPEKQTEAATDGPIPEKSIAVLPFDNLSDDKSNAYFAEGIQDEIITRLAKIADLKVISRTSTRQFASAPGSLRDIGKQLGVANVLEGSVQKIANAVHINVQLIRAASDQHLWAESYNRKLDDVFAVEGEVANTIADQLNVKLSGAERKVIAEKPTQNPAAHDAYIRGRNIVSQGITSESAPEAAMEFLRAVQLDPTFAQAWAQLAVVRSYMYFNGLDTPASVKEAVDRAMALQPDSGEAWLAQAMYDYRVLRQFSIALEAYREAQRRLPNDADVLEQMAHVERRLGQRQAAERDYRAAAQLDPQNVDPLLALAELLANANRVPESNDVIERLLKLSPGNEEVLRQKAFNLQQEGRLADSAAVLNGMNPNSPAEDVAVAREQQFILERRLEDAIALVKSGKPAGWATQPQTLTTLGLTQKAAGHDAEAKETFTRALFLMKGPDGQIPVDGRYLPSWAILDYAGLGQKEQALSEAEHARAAYKDDALSRPVVELRVAIMYVLLGDNETALATLSRLVDSGEFFSQSGLRFAPVWDPLRNDPRFQALLKKLGLDK